MYKLLNLQTSDIKVVHDIMAHHRDHNAAENDEFERIQCIVENLTPHVNNDNLHWELHVEEMVPQTADCIINDITFQIKKHGTDDDWGSELCVYYENLFWTYLLEHYGFDHEEHQYLLKSDQVESQRYALMEIAKTHANFYDESLAFGG